MITQEIKIRTRYSETDAMGVIYHANYINYYEVARTAMVKEIGNYSYKQMEIEGIMMPVIEAHCRYIGPAYYDEEITIRTTVKELPTAKITFNHEVFNEKGTLVNTGYVVLAFMNTTTRRPCRPPETLMNLMRPYFELPKIELC